MQSGAERGLGAQRGGRGSRHCSPIGRRPAGRHRPEIRPRARASAALRPRPAPPPPLLFVCFFLSMGGGRPSSPRGRRWGLLLLSDLRTVGHTPWEAAPRRPHPGRVLPRGPAGAWGRGAALRGASPSNWPLCALLLLPAPSARSALVPPPRPPSQSEHAKCRAGAAESQSTQGGSWALFIETPVCSLGRGRQEREAPSVRPSVGAGRGPAAGPGALRRRGGRRIGSRGSGWGPGGRARRAAEVQ